MGLRRLLSCSAFVGSLFAVVNYLWWHSRHFMISVVTPAQHRRMRWNIPSMIWGKSIQIYLNYQRPQGSFDAFVTIREDHFLGLVAQYDLTSSPAVPPRIRCRTVLLFLHSVASPCDSSTCGGEERCLLSCGWLQNQLFGDLD